MQCKNQTHGTSLAIVFWNLGLGGVQRKVVDLCRHIKKKEGYGHIEAHLILKNKEGFSLDRQLPRERVHIHYRPTWWGGRLRVFFFLYILFKLIQLKPAGVLSFLDLASVYTVVAAKFIFWRRINVIINEDILTSFQVRSKIIKALIRLIYPYADTIISPTKISKKDLVRNFDINSDKIVVIPNWTKLIRNARVISKEYDLLFAGRFSRQKNLFFLLKAVKKITDSKPNLSVCLLGEGDKKEKIMRFIKRHRLQENVLIRNPTYQIRKYLRSAEVFVLTSKYEGMPVVLLEAMACRVPVLVRKYPGVEEYVDHGSTGYIEKDIGSFSKRAIWLLEKPKKRKRISGQAHKVVKKHYSHHNIDRYLNYIFENKQNN